MRFLIEHAATQTYWFVGFCLLALLISCRKKTSVHLSKNTTAELKGFAILTIVLAHIGYYLSEDTQFLSPFSNMAGVGVNLFLFLSGYGLTVSALTAELSPWQFYRKRLGKIFVPAWVVLIIFFVADSVFLHLHYSWTTIWQSFLGFFPYADIYTSVDAPLWYFSLIVFYYLLFPLVFLRRFAYLSSIVVAVIGYYVSELTLPVDGGVAALYRLHTFAFPLGMLAATISMSKWQFLLKKQQEIQAFFSQLRWPAYLVRCLLLAIAMGVFAYTFIDSGVGRGYWIEQQISLVNMMSIMAIFMLKPFENRFFQLIGIYSYEIYLLHWPLMYRYDFLYSWLPASIATFAYIFVFIGIAMAFRKLEGRFDFYRGKLFKKDCSSAG